MSVESLDEGLSNCRYAREDAMKLKCFEKVRIHIAGTEGKAGDKYLEGTRTAAQPIEKDQVIGRKHVQENQPSLPPKNKKSTQQVL